MRKSKQPTRTKQRKRKTIEDVPESNGTVEDEMEFDTNKYAIPLSLRD